MRRTRLLGIGIGGAIVAPALLATLTGCGLANGAITVVGTNPGAAGGGTSTPLSVASAQNANATQHRAGPLGTASVRATDGSGAAGSAATGSGGAGGAVPGGSGTANGAGSGTEPGAGSQGAANGNSGRTTSGSGAGGSTGRTPGSGSGSGSTATGQSGDAVCTVADLRLRVTLAGNASAGPGTDNQRIRRQQVTLVLTNISSSKCVLRGYPNIDFLRSGAHGQLSEPDTFSAAHPVTSVELKPGGAATATATFVTNSPRNAHGLHCDDAVALRAFPPGSTVAISAGIRDAHGSTLPQFYICGHGVVVTALQP